MLISTKLMLYLTKSQSKFQSSGANEEKKSMSLIREVLSQNNKPKTGILLWKMDKANYSNDHKNQMANTILRNAQLEKQG